MTIPTIGAVTASAASVGQYNLLELTIANLTTQATNPYLPYDASVPAYAANLKPKEDARLGVSVDALFLPPGQTDWANALVQPCFLYQPYTQTALAGGTTTSPVELLVPNGPPVWKARFAPMVVGLAWMYKIRVTDAGGGPVTSATGVFDCVASASHGFLRVSSSDARYFKLDDGTLPNLIGQNIVPINGITNWQAVIDQVANTGATTLIRHWIAGRSGQEVIGGFANSSGGRFWGFNGNTFLDGGVAHTGRFSASVPDTGSQLVASYVPLKPNQSYTITAWVLPGTATSVNIHSEDGAALGYTTQVDTLIPVSGTSWVQLTAHIAAHNPAAGASFFGTVKISSPTGSFHVDDITVTDDSTGYDAIEVGDFERHIQYSQRQSFLVDEMFAYAESKGQYLRTNCLENDDSVFCNIDATGLPAAHNVENFYGQNASLAADLPVRRFHRYYARYLMARWGYSTAGAQWEFNNEGGPDPNHYAAAQSWAAAIHSFAAHERRMTGTSFYLVSGGSSYPQNFYDPPASATFPDIDYADIHAYPGEPGTGYQPFPMSFGGFVQSTTGGPNGMGYLSLDGTLSPVPSQNTTLPLLHIQGQGDWIISCQIRADTTAHGDSNGIGPDLYFTCSDVGINGLHIPNTPYSPLLPFAGCDQWHPYSATFSIADNLEHQVGLTAFATGLTGGKVYFSDIRVIAPDGLLFAHYQFNEPSVQYDSAALSQYPLLQYTSLSGDPVIGKPFSIGEIDFVNPDGSYNTTIQSDTAGHFARQFFWAHLNPSGGIGLLYNNAGNVINPKGFWRFAAAVQKMLAGLPLDNGRYRNVDATVSGPNLIVIGQKDVQAGRAHFFVYNRNGNWYNLTTNPGGVVSASGSVAVSGLPDRSYTVQQWDTTTGAVLSTSTLTSAGGVLTVPILPLVADTAFTISPAAAPGAIPAGVYTASPVVGRAWTGSVCSGWTAPPRPRVR